MNKLFEKICNLPTLLLLGLLLLSLIMHSCVQSAYSDTTQIKEIKYGRKDMIRNDLVKSNNEVFKSVIESQNLQITSLNKAFFIMQNEYSECSAKLEKCKCK